MAEVWYMKLSRNTILITGATSGIGLEMARRFHALGNKIIAVGRNASKLGAMEGEMDDLTGIVCDLSKPEDLHMLSEKVYAHFPELNVLINNAGLQHQMKFGEGQAEWSEIDDEIDVNLRALVHLTNELLPLLKGKDQSAVVNVSSGLGFAPKKSAPVYCATKAAVHAFSMALRYQLEDTSVKVFEVIPSLVDTPMTEGRGQDKLSVSEMVDEFVVAYKRDHWEVNIGKVKILRTLLRIWPNKALGLLKNA